MVRERGTAPCISSRGNGKQAVPYSKRLDKVGHRIGNLFAKLKDWHPIAPGQDRCTPIFLSTVLLAATLFFCLSLLNLRPKEPLN